MTARLTIHTNFKHRNQSFTNAVTHTAFDKNTSACNETIR